jgi:hypothetical protein
MYMIYNEMYKKLKNTCKLKSNINTENVDCEKILNDKIIRLQNIIRNTILSIKNSKFKDIFSNNDAILSISILTDLYDNTKSINKFTTTNKNDQLKKIDILENITNKLQMIVCGFGTENMTDLFYLCFEYDYNITVNDPIIKAKIDLITKYIHPVGCKIIPWKPHKTINSEIKIITNKITDDIINIEDACSYECFDIDKSARSFYQKIFGIRTVIHDQISRKTIIVIGIVDDVQIDCFSNEYIFLRQNEITDMANNLDIIEKDIIIKLLESFSLKEILIFGNEDIQKKMIGCITEVNNIKQTKLDITIKKFIDLEYNSQRNMLINLLVHKDDDEVQYLCYILYDILSSGKYEYYEQYNVLDSLPLKIKKFFKDVVKYTTKYTNDMMQKYDIHKITLEQQIYLMKANDIVKEKAIIKLKEIKSRSDETGLKAKQYLEALLKIPFHVYKEEPVLKRIKDINKNFIKMTLTIEQIFENIQEIGKIKKEKYSITEIINNIKKIDSYLNENIFTFIKNTITLQSNKQVLNIINHINTIKKSKKHKRILTTNKCKTDFINCIIDYLNENKENKIIVSDIFDTIHTEIPYSLNKSFNDIANINSNITQIESAINQIENVLDESIYGHKNAKNQIIKIIAQWMNGEQTGYCFGFEGCPGVGKTSLAKKGLANCLKDDDGNSRPFAFVAIGGSSSGSLLDGHGYTYMNSSWGKIVDILIETKCMNPIIYIDELDKVSKTENGKEIIGILTHLIDPAQNDKFQDKYFSGIDIDLSKALFIFSYNDPDQIDRILLDRIHRIKFDNLTVNDKLVISRKFILPEINKKMGFENIIEISDETIEYIINNYTMEPGVRKLKEIFFDLFGEINLTILKTNLNSEELEIPIIITKENITEKYLFKHNKNIEKKMHEKPEIGIINGLWANSLANGGIIPIQAFFFPSSTFLELKLTGLQGDVMKESMNVAKTLAWNLTDTEIKKKWIQLFDETREQGIHIHCPEGSISKDGPSAGAAITVALYSLFSKKPIKNTAAITGEICLNGEVTSIGGLENKINGGIRAGITTFLFPKSNNKDFIEWKKKDNNANYCNNIRFIEISTINDILNFFFNDKL